MAHGMRQISCNYSVDEIIKMLKEGKTLRYGGLKSSEDSDGYVTRWGFYISDYGQVEIGNDEIIEIVTKLTK